MLVFQKNDAKTYRELAEYFRVVLDNMIGPWFSNPPVSPSFSAMAMETTVEGLNMMRVQMPNPKNLVNELFESNEVKYLLLSFIKSVKRFRHENTILFTMHMALDEPLQWKCTDFNPDINRCMGVLLIDDPQEI